MNHAQSILRIERDAIDSLVTALHARQYTVVGPTIRDGALVYDELHSALDLPAGWTDEQEAGVYNLKRREDGALFSYNVGQHAWKKFLFPASCILFSARRNNGDGGDGFVIDQNQKTPLLDSSEPTRYAFLGVRPCELAALQLHDNVFAGIPYEDPNYKALRERLFIVAVNCSKAGNTCFCASMNTGPTVSGGFDLALTEILDQQQHYFVVETGSERGEQLMNDVAHRPASEAEVKKSREVGETVARQMGRSLNTTGIKELLYANLEHPRWDDIARRCLTCANCTMVCPTCFCSTVEDTTNLVGTEAYRTRVWDSCFTVDFSYLHGGSVRASVRARYRQWLTHKFAGWQDQFGVIGCVGCGRCITWCPVGIDLTQEVNAIRETASSQAPAHSTPSIVGGE